MRSRTPDFDDDGQYDDAEGVQPAFSAALLDGPGSVTVGLRVTDSRGATGFDTATINVSNVAPAAGVAGPIRLTGVGGSGASSNIGVRLWSGIISSAGGAIDELDQITAGTLQIGDATTGPITISAAISPASAAILCLTTGANILDANSTGTNLTVSDLRLQAATGIGVTGNAVEVAVSRLDAQNSTSGDLWLQAADTVTVDRLLLGGGSGWLRLSAGAITLPSAVAGSETVRNLGTGRTDLSSAGSGGGLTLGAHAVRTIGELIVTAVSNPLTVTNTAEAPEITVGGSVSIDSASVGSASNHLGIQGASRLSVNDPGPGDIFLDEIGSSTIAWTLVTVRGTGFGTLDIDYLGTDVVDINENADVNNVVLDHALMFTGVSVDPVLRNIDVTGGDVDIYAIRRRMGTWGRCPARLLPAAS
jgi:hypothetical protein